MGAYSPASLIDKKVENKILKKIVEQTLKALIKEKQPYTGFLYVGLMIKNNDPYLIEYNVRMGDPECQVILPRLKTDIVKIFINAMSNSLDKIKIEWKNLKCMTVVLCSKGSLVIIKNIKIKNLNNSLIKNMFIFHVEQDYKK